MTTQRTLLTVQIVEKLGAPLLAAVAEVAVRGASADPPQTLYAERLAELLARSIQVSVSLSGKLDLNNPGGNPDAVTLALAGVAAGLVAGLHKHTGRVPDDNELKRLIAALEAIMVFGDNFAPVAENTLRLINIEAGAEPADESQVNIQYINALAPVVNAVAAYSFGMPEKKMVQEVAERLIDNAVRLARLMSPAGADEKETKRAELRILRGLVPLYVECHEAERQRLMRKDAASETISTAPVWEAFDIRAAMMETLGMSLQTERPASSAAASGGRAPIPAKPGASAPAAPPPAAPPAGQAAASALSSGAYNPMSFFTTKR